MNHDKNTKTIVDPLNYQATFEEQLRVDNERVSGVKSVRQQRPKSARPTRNSNFPVATDFSEAGSVVEEKDEYLDEDFEPSEKTAENYVIPTK